MTDYYGYAGCVLDIDLSSGKINRKELDMDLAEKFLGGFGLSMKVAFDVLKPNTPWSSPDNPIIIAAGPFNGTPLTGCAKIAGATKLPQAGAISSGSGSMRFGAMLKLAGYDLVVIRGKAEKPVYLTIFDDRVEINEASKLWGRDLYDATDALWEKHGSECSVAAIGTAGENKVLPSLALVDKIGGWMRGGGAVWGSKNLKAIVVRGTKGISVADRKGFVKLAEEIIERTRSYKYHKDWVDWGVMISWDRWVGLVGGYPTKNFTELYPAKDIDRDYGPKKIMEVFDKINIGCASCGASDKHMLRVKDGDLKGFTTYFSTIFGSFGYGVTCGADYPTTMTIHDTLQRCGLDWLTVAPMLEWAFELYEKGIIDQKDTGGLVLEPTAECMKTFYHQIAQREGFGDILAGGWQEAIERIGRGCEEYAYVVKGTSPPYDGRMGLGTDVLSGLLNPRVQLARGGSPTLMSADVPIDLFRNWAVKIGMPPEAQERIFADSPTVNIPRSTRYAEDWMAVFDSLGICGRATINRLYDISLVQRLYESLTGIPLGEKDILMAGERAMNMERAINAREGFSRKDDQAPPRWFKEPLEGAGKKLSFQDFYRTRDLDEQGYNQLLDEYFNERGWDKQTGNPTEEKLSSLGLKFAIDT